MQEKALVISDRKYLELQHISAISQKHTMTCNLFTMRVYLKHLLGFRCTFGNLVYQLLQIDLNTSWKAYVGSLGVVPHSEVSEQTPSQLKHPNVNYRLILFSNDLSHSPQQYHQPILKSRSVNGICSKNKAFFVWLLSWKAEMCQQTSAFEEVNCEQGNMRRLNINYMLLKK